MNNQRHKDCMDWVVHFADPWLGGIDEERLEVNVIFTTYSGTLAALELASRLGANLGACPKVLMLYAVLYALPLEKPAVSIEFLEERVRAVTRVAPTTTTAQIFLCRDSRRTVSRVLQPHSLIVMGGKKRWWPTTEQSLAMLLRKEGHEVIFVTPAQLRNEVGRYALHN
jgi:hypothetical protein